MKAPALSDEPCGLFLAVRRGVPLTLSAILALLALVLPGARGWCILGAVACLAELGPSFRRGASYLRSRGTIVRWDNFWVRAMRPLFRSLGMEDAWILSFCAWNNRRVRKALSGRKARRAQVLLPHCVQLARCDAPVQQDLESCTRCGLCAIQDVLARSLQDRWDVHLSNRSAKAYRAAREARPDLVVAVACPDRLLKGITRISEIPSYVIPLGMPHGMCVDTCFDVDRLLAALEALAETKHERDSKIQPLRSETSA